MKIVFLFFCIITYATFSYAQNITVGSGEKPLLKSLVKTTTQGNVFFYNGFANGKIITAEQKEFSVINLRYNLETQELEYLENDLVYAVLDAVQSFSLLDSVGNTHLFVKLPPDQPTGFYEILVDGRISLLKLHTIKKEVTEDWYTKKKTNKILKLNIYFIKKDNAFEKLTPSTKNVVTALIDKKDELTAFIKDEQLDVKQGDDLVKIFKYFNALK